MEVRGQIKRMYKVRDQLKVRGQLGMMTCKVKGWLKVKGQPDQ